MDDKRDPTEMRQTQPRAKAARLPPGTQIASYRIEQLVGEGGMGSVYGAVDTKLNRPVAIKFLSADVADAEARQRFKQEAEATSSLNHPHIVTVHDVGEHAGRQYIVSELVDGGTLVEWAARPRTWKQRVELLIGVADAIAAAHAADILHRDIKPGNILIGSNGYAKLADFGLAKLADATAEPKRGQTTGVGFVVGTVAYMSPEQCTGDALDARSDIFSFGVVLYEVLAGHRPFEAANDLELMKTILHGSPPPLPEELPEPLRLAVDKALEKDPAERYQSMRELVVDLKRVVQKRGAHPAAASDAPRRASRVGWAIAGALGLALLTALVPTIFYFARETPFTAVVRFRISAPGVSTPFALSLSPDGRRIAYIAYNDENLQIFVRPLDALEPQPVPRTDDAQAVFWSADGRMLGFVAGNALKKVSLDGGQPQSVAVGVVPAGGSWNRDDVLLVASPSAATNGGVAAVGRVAAGGGPIVAVTSVDAARGEVGHFGPRFLPDGRHYLYARSSLPVGAAPTREVTLMVGSLDGGAAKQLLALPFDTTGNRLPVNYDYAEGYLLFTRDDTLFAQRFDVDALTLSGEPTALAGPISQFSVAPGVLVYREGLAQGRDARNDVPTTELRWFDRDGLATGTLGPPSKYADPQISRDGRRVAVDALNGDRRDVWVLDVARGVPVRLTFDRYDEGAPSWSPDGRWVAFASNRDSMGAFPNALYRHAAGGGGADELLFQSGAGTLVAPMDWSPEGEYLLFSHISLAEVTAAGDIWALEMSGERGAAALVTGAGRKSAGRVSPDGRWLAYATTESGTEQIVVQPFPDTSKGKWQLSTGGGSEPKWRGDGKEIFYLAPDGSLMAVDVDAAGDDLTFGQAHVLFQTGVPPRPFTVTFDASPDGQRFLVNVPTGERSPEAPPEPGALTVVVNWASELEVASSGLSR